MKFTQEHEELRRTVRQFVDKEINPHVKEWEAAGRFPIHEVFKKMGDLGLLGVTKPVEYGGMGLDYSYGMVMSEEMGTVHCGGVPLAVGVQTDMATPALARFGSDQLRRDYLAPAIAGDMVASIAVSEPQAGSDVAAVKTTAKKDGDDYVINGTKMWITNSPSADFFCLLANTSDDKPHINKSLIVVPKDAAGITVDKPLDKLGMRSSETAQVFFDNVRVPQRNLIGQEGMGFMMQMMQFQEERLFAASNSLKGMEHVINETIEYARERKVFGMSLLDNQTVHFRLAELQTEVEALRALTYRACDLYINGQDVLQLASMAKLKVGRLAREVADACLQFWGGNGFMWDNPASQLYRDGRLGSIGGGADEIMLGIICKTMNTLPGKKR
ncbi:Acyl-CoA dehydrogenase [Alloalcanivorax dieselolei B5]|uniref:Acyl-CoA dehydrogenase n=1 Tax=Alcanivorax dieselolei (strain DSM 16502 / CGMCC 1.3690 / MCCC 1A00001 / B-5) TaxID=930169 RepID=K0C973_ALCDB|nr:acyl-CoA dehydrogenase family protein [Alloalcanivorax dieselolei]AFT70074.1 Acyl-CoA dehydrogenase [Alloalcanivorax dieselolei B5]GGJ96684.1 citronellyl-CoA dehydrogenase [Alloalcanivorax dieselolei]